MTRQIIWWQTAMGVFLLGVVALLSWQAGTLAAMESRTAGSAGAAGERTAPLVAIDPGHGGGDPGKVGTGGQLEKEINLQVALKLRDYLEASGARVVMTREKDEALWNEGDSRRKAADMRNRCAGINEARPDLTVSIHQNSYHEEGISGGQVFYYKGSERGRELAEILQRRFNYVIGEKNTRQVKANESYYLLLHVKSPIVIVECGFLSNPAEAAALESAEYQDRLAWTIHMGVWEYLNGREEGRSSARRTPEGLTACARR